MSSTKIVNPGNGYITGEIKIWTTTTPPSGGWLICDGSAVSLTTYADLYNVIGVIYGDPGSGNFNIPDLRGKVAVGHLVGDPDFGTLAGVGGEKTHTLSDAEGSIASHNHSGSTSTSANHAHTNHTGNNTGTQSVQQGTGSSVNVASSNHSHQSATTDNEIGAHSHTITVDAVAGASASTAHNNLQPYIVLNYIIKT